MESVPNSDDDKYVGLLVGHGDITTQQYNLCSIDFNSIIIAGQPKLRWRRIINVNLKCRLIG